MRQLTKELTLKSFMTLFMLAIFQAALWAQDGGSSSGSGSGSSSSGSSTTTTTKSLSVSSDSGWYTSPWVWVIGAAVFILLLVALMRGGSSSGTVASRTDKVTVTKSSSTDL